jgi:DNA-binding MarR family transcriptional regulator
MPIKNRNDRVAEFRLGSFLPFRLVVVTDSVYRMFAENYVGSFNLTIPEIRALSVIAEHGTLSPTAVGQHALMDKVKVSRATQSLVAKGLLRQRQDPNDGRSRLLRLTRKGAAVHAKFVSLATRLEAMLFGNLSRADLNALNRILTKITTRLETTGEIDRT